MNLFDRAPHTVTVITPAIRTDRYGSEVRDYGPDARRVKARGWLQQHTRIGGDLAEVTRPAGFRSDWTFSTRHEITPADRIETRKPGPDGEQRLRVFEVEGDPYPASSPRGVHHYEVRLRLVEG